MPTQLIQNERKYLLRLFAVWETVKTQIVINGKKQKKILLKIY